uniref:2Fe-2S ferredoxin-type domain-containing protein n=1 Tax=Rhodosorus marinus TaxID=101924 RepID=A0A7S3A9G5_9RHOD|mmetsp:Transcript_5132/g.22158  ORF Transcript_5132/g.22158 Transcript_5132/m.22158 type:complete len:140 (+) Transcript_5132:694-1113(+)
MLLFSMCMSSSLSNSSDAMPSTVTFKGRKIAVNCDSGKWTSLRTILIRAGVSPHNGQSSWFNCRGLGTCGTCAVEVVSGEVLPAKRSYREDLRLNFPPHHNSDKLRLCCQMTPVDSSDIVLRKYSGMWGQNVDEEIADG